MAHGITIEVYPYTTMGVCSCGKWSKLVDGGWRVRNAKTAKLRKELYAAHYQHCMEAEATK